MSDECIFCKIINNEFNSATIFENNEFKVILDKFPASEGHILIIPKNHIKNIFEIEQKQAGRLFELVVSICKVVKDVLNVEDINILQNNGSIAGQTVFHFHLHIIPRYENDNINISWKSEQFSDEYIENLRLKIFKNIQYEHLENSISFVSDIFEEPKKWGLRGDPFLWEYLKDYYSNTKIPYSVENLENDIFTIFKKFTGEFPQKNKNFFVKDFESKFGGLSNGNLSSDFWLNTAIPILSERLEKLNNDM